MSDIYNITKNDCLKIIKHDDYISIHPLLNNICDYSTPFFKGKPDMCHVLPQFLKNNEKEENILLINLTTRSLKEKIKNDPNSNNINLFDDMNISDKEMLDDDIKDDIKNPKLSKNNIEEKKSLTNDCHDGLICIDPLFNFTLPINKNNFLDIVFQISSLEDLKKWLSENDLKKLPIRMINTVFDLFWENCYNKIDEDINLFIEINKKLINVIFEKDLAIVTLKKIVNRMIKNNYGKKIKYLDKIKKYLMKYI